MYNCTSLTTKRFPEAREKSQGRSEGICVYCTIYIVNCTMYIVYSTKRAVVCNRNSFNFDGLFGLFQYLLVSQAHRLRICLLSSPPYSHSFHYYGKLDQNGDLLSVGIHSLCAPERGI